MRTLIVSQNTEHRLSLKRHVLHTPLFSEAMSENNFREALTALSEQGPFDVVFIANSFSQNDLALFIERARATQNGMHSAYILVVKTEEQNAALVSNGMMVGIHGFLCEPLSVASIEEIAAIARQVKLQTTQLRLRTATGLLLSEVANEFEEVPGKQAGIPQKDLWQKVQDACNRYKEVTGESVTSAVVPNLQKIAPSKRIPSYTGVSKRVRYLFENKFRKGLEALSRTKETPPE